MHKLEPPDTHYFFAAIGWLELGNLAEARAELAQVSAAQQEHPDVLEVRWSIAAEQKRWEEGLQIAQALLRRAPERSLRLAASGLCPAPRPGRGRAEGLGGAAAGVRQVPQRANPFPSISACYACQMRQLDAARDWLRRAIGIGGKEKIKRDGARGTPIWSRFGTRSGSFNGSGGERGAGWQPA